MDYPVSGSELYSLKIQSIQKVVLGSRRPSRELLLRTESVLHCPSLFRMLWVVQVRKNLINKEESVSWVLDFWVLPRVLK